MSGFDSCRREVLLTYGFASPMLSFGMGEKKKKVRFPREGGEEVSLEIRQLVEREEKDKDPEISALKGIHHHHHYHRAESFVKDGTTFLWEVEPESQFQKALFKVILRSSIIGLENGKLM